MTITGVPSANPDSEADRLRRWSLQRLAVLEDDLIDHPVFLDLFRVHDLVALNILFDARDGLTGMLRKNAIDRGAHAKNFFGMKIDVGSLTAEAAHPGLVDEDAGIRQGEALFGSTASEKNRSDRRGLANARGDHIGLDELHGVVNGEARGD